MKKLGLVLSSTVVLACGVLVPSALGSSAHTASGPAITVQIKSLTKNLLGPVTVHGETGWITKGGTPRGKCSGDSAGGALDAATHGKWKATWDAKYSDVFVTSILGLTPPKVDYWEILVNGKPASVGLCAIKLHAGQRLVFKVAK